MSRTLSESEITALGNELDALLAETRKDLGARDVAHIRTIVRRVRQLEAGGRLLLAIGMDPVTFTAGTAALALSKILENMEVGHNVLHGQYDWTNDPELASKTYEWDIACPADDWRHSHNYEHHTFTNVLGKDRDVGYAFLRITPKQAWNASHAVQPVSAAVLALFFQWGVAMHDLRLWETVRGEQTVKELATRAKPFLRKASGQLAKDYVLFPLLALGNAPRVLAGNLLANGARNLWTFGIIFCGHFPAGVEVYPEDTVHNESRGGWYVRQINGSANLSGGRWLHVLSGHLSHQIEHHLFPDLPASRYPEIAPRVREICARYGQTYNTGSLGKQLRSVVKKLVVHALPTAA